MSVFLLTLLCPTEVVYGSNELKVVANLVSQFQYLPLEGGQPKLVGIIDTPPCLFGTILYGLFDIPVLRLTL